MQSNSVLAYVNPYAGFYLDDPDIKDFLSIKLDSTMYKSHSSDLSDISSYFKSGTYDEMSVIDGLSVEQLRGSMESGGTHVNASILGILMNPARWNEILSDVSVGSSIRFIKIPYDLYKKAAKEKAVEQGEYDKQNINLELYLKTFPTYKTSVLH